MHSHGNTVASAWGRVLTATGSMAIINPLRYRGYVYDHETGLYYLQSRYYNPELGRFLNADAYTSTGQGLLGNNMFAYCGNNPVCREDPTGEFWWLIPVIVAIPFLLTGCSPGEKSKDEVLVFSNAEEGWMSSSQKMGDDMADAVGASSSQVVATTTENFTDTWNNTTASHIIVHTHGSPGSLQGDGFSFETTSAGQLIFNDNIKYVLITACETGGRNGSYDNIGQLLSRKIARDGVVVCCTTVVSGGSVYFTATDRGRWVVYRNGTQIAADLPTTITMKIIANYWNS